MGRKKPNRLLCGILFSALIVSVLIDVYLSFVSFPGLSVAVSLLILVLVCILFIVCICQSRNLQPEGTACSGNEDGMISFKDIRGVVRLSARLSDIYYIESADNYIKVWLGNDGKMTGHVVRCSMKSVEAGCSGTPLMRVHRKYIVNSDKVKAFRRESDGFYLDFYGESLPSIAITKTYLDGALRRFRVQAIILAFFLCLGMSAEAKPDRLWAKNGQGRSKVILTPYIAASSADSTAVIICPGGSYFWLDKVTEGHEVALWLQSQGISAFVLEYRVGGKFNFPTGARLLYGGNRFPYMLQDVQKAIMTVRTDSTRYRHVGVMGFSAGGHLSMLSAIYPYPEFLAKCKEEAVCPLRPDFVAPIYPVVTLNDKSCLHRRSRRGIMGEYRMNNKALADSLSIEKHISADCPPVFLLNCTDDPVVDYHNSVLLDSALTSRGISHLYTRFPVGGHGFGCRSIEYEEGELDWKPLFLDWLKSVFQSSR